MWLFVVLGAVVVLLLLGAGGCFRMRLGGSLTLKDLDGSFGTVELGPWPWAREQTGDLLGKAGLLTVRGSLFHPAMRVSLHWTGGPPEKGDLEPGGHIQINGIDIFHSLGERRRHP